MQSMPYDHAESVNEFLSRAITFATNAHKDQNRRDGSPYILHPMRVMMQVYRKLSDLGVVPHIPAAAAVLHDVVEDCGVSIDHIRAQFGNRVADLVRALSRQKDESYPEFILRVSRAGDMADVIKIEDIRDNLEWPAAPVFVADAVKVGIKRQHYTLAMDFLMGRIPIGQYLQLAKMLDKNKEQLLNGPDVPLTC